VGERRTEKGKKGGDLTLTTIFCLSSGISLKRPSPFQKSSRRRRRRKGSRRQWVCLVTRPFGKPPLPFLPSLPDLFHTSPPLSSVVVVVVHDGGRRGGGRGQLRSLHPLPPPLWLSGKGKLLWAFGISTAQWAPKAGQQQSCHKSLSHTIKIILKKLFIQKFLSICWFFSVKKGFKLSFSVAAAKQQMVFSHPLSSLFPSLSLPLWVRMDPLIYFSFCPFARARENSRRERETSRPSAGANARPTSTYLCARRRRRRRR
jgi:hypothetical protein